jgi:hypothetical protein
LVLLIDSDILGELSCLNGWLLLPIGLDILAVSSLTLYNYCQEYSSWSNQWIIETILKKKRKGSWECQFLLSLVNSQSCQLSVLSTLYSNCQKDLFLPHRIPRLCKICILITKKILPDNTRFQGTILSLFQVCYNLLVPYVLLFANLSFWIYIFQVTTTSNR